MQLPRSFIDKPGTALQACTIDAEKARRAPEPLSFTRFHHGIKTHVVRDRWLCIFVSARPSSKSRHLATKEGLKVIKQSKKPIKLAAQKLYRQYKRARGMEPHPDKARATAAATAAGEGKMYYDADAAAAAAVEAARERQEAKRLKRKPKKLKKLEEKRELKRQHAQATLQQLIREAIEMADAEEIEDGGRP